jgi:PII-like signaling protein
MQLADRLLASADKSLLAKTGAAVLRGTTGFGDWSTLVQLRFLLKVRTK